MKLQVTQENLHRALSAVSRVASNRNSLPILANILLKTVDNRLVIAGTNLDIAITETIGAKVTEEGSLTIPARLLQDFVSNLPNDVVELQSDDFKLKISTGKYTSTINGMNPDEFPVMPAITNGKTIKLKTADFKKALQQSVFAASSDDTRPVLTSVYVHSHASKLTLAATDSYRLAEKTTSGVKEEVKLLVPATTMSELLRIFGDHNNEETTLTFDEQQVRFQAGDVEVISRLIDGNYPDYRKLIPAKFEVSAETLKSELLAATKVASLFAREAAGSIQIEVDDTKNELSVKSVASQVGENSSAVAAIASGNGAMTLNSRYLMDALNALTGDKVVFCMNGKLEPCILKDPADPSALQVVMPVKS